MHNILMIGGEYMLSKISGKELAKELTIRFFTSSILRTFINTLIPILISVYSLRYNKDVKLNWYIPIILMTLFILIYNIIAEIILAKQRREIEYWEFLEEAYRNHCSLNRRSATKIYRLNKIITNFLKKNEPIDKVVFDKMADFSTIAFDVCNGIYKIVEKEFGEDTECEVTVFQATNDGITMIAYANKNEDPPISYRRNYVRSSSQYLFGKLFKDLNAQIFVCSTQKEVQENFKFIDESIVREGKICQYIGIPLLTARKKIEILLQIDVSKPNVFGRNKEEVLKFAENVFYPYVMLLNKTYERDLIFDGYYDIIVDKLSGHESVGENENN